MTTNAPTPPAAPPLRLVTPAPAPAEPRTPWNPPGGARSYVLKRRVPVESAPGTVGPGFGWERCTAKDDAGQVHDRHELPTARELILAVWGGGEYAVTFHGEDGRGCGRGAFTLAAEPRPAGASGASVQKMPAADVAALEGVDVDADDAGDVSQGDDLQGDADGDDEGAGDVVYAAAPVSDEAARLRAELAEAKEAMARMAAAQKATRLQAMTTPVLPPRPPRQPVRFQGRSAEVQQALSEFSAMQDAAEAAADRRIQHQMALDEMRRREDDARHMRAMAEQSAWFERALTFERKFTERAEAAAAAGTKELRKRVEELEETPVRESGVLETAFAEALPTLTEAAGVIAKAKFAK